MSQKSWLRKLFQQLSPASKHERRRARSSGGLKKMRTACDLRVEALEPRWVPSVTANNDLYILPEDGGSIHPATYSAGILGNDNPSTGLTVVQTSANPGHGTFSLTSTGPSAGTFTFTPD